MGFSTINPYFTVPKVKNRLEEVFIYRRCFNFGEEWWTRRGTFMRLHTSFLKNEENISTYDDFPSRRRSGERQGYMLEKEEKTTVRRNRLDFSKKLQYVGIG